ncbi:MAG: putative rane protein [Verrucomicrobiota bacterium]|jgi:putative membrane protein
MKKPLISLSRIALIVAGCALCLGPAAQAAKEPAKTEQPKPSASPATAALSTKDKSFMKDAAKGGMMEVDMGKMAQEKGKSAEVKKIGSRMVADHSKANAELMAIAKKKGVDLSKEKPSAHKMDEANFDKAYVDMMVKDHEKDLAAFQAEAKDGSDADVKAFASKTSEVIKKHLEMVKAAQGKMK